MGIDYIYGMLLNFIAISSLTNNYASGSIFSGLITATATSPVDVIKTRIMSDSGKAYKNSFDCLIKLLRHEGIPGLCM